MKLEQLRDHLRINILDDQATPQLWSDETLDLYINQAQDEAAIRARLFRRSESITVLAGSNLIDLESDVIEVIQVVLPGYGALEPLDDRALPMQAGVTNRTGRPSRFIPASPVLGMGSQVQIYPTPAFDVQLSVTVNHTPAPLEDAEDECLIPSSRQLAMLHWAAYLAYSMRDSDAEDKTRATSHEQKFIEAFGMRHDAATERSRADKRRHTTRINPLWRC